jgi:hypothetical protein
VQEDVRHGAVVEEVDDPALPVAVHAAQFVDPELKVAADLPGPVDVEGAAFPLEKVFGHDPKGEGVEDEGNVGGDLQSTPELGHLIKNELLRSRLLFTINSRTFYFMTLILNLLALAHSRRHFIETSFSLTSPAIAAEGLLSE